MRNALLADDRERRTTAQQAPVAFLVPATQLTGFVTGMEQHGNRDVNGQESGEFARPHLAAKPPGATVTLACLTAPAQRARDLSVTSRSTPARPFPTRRRMPDRAAQRGNRAWATRRAKPASLPAQRGLDKTECRQDGTSAAQCGSALHATRQFPAQRRPDRDNGCRRDARRPPAMPPRRTRPAPAADLGNLSGPADITQHLRVEMTSVIDGEIPVTVRPVYPLGPRPSQSDRLHRWQVPKPAGDMTEKHVIVHGPTLAATLIAVIRIFSPPAPD